MIIGPQQEPVVNINDDATRRSLAAPTVANRQSWKLFRLLRSFFAAAVIGQRLTPSSSRKGFAFVAGGAEPREVSKDARPPAGPFILRDALRAPQDGGIRNRTATMINVSPP
ncbi:hypothetical protein ACQPTN_41145 [Bradyrhizobium sp. 13971]